MCLYRDILVMIIKPLLTVQRLTKAYSECDKSALLRSRQCSMAPFCVKKLFIALLEVFFRSHIYMGKSAAILSFSSGHVC